MAGSARPTLLLLGGTGQIGWELARTLAPLGRVVAPERASAPLDEPPALAAAVRAARPDVIVNAAAYTAVDRAESDEAAAEAVNAVAPGVLAETAAGLGAVLVHFSTDYVFDGRARRPYREDDPTGPLGVYGRTKLAGEEAVRRAGGRHLVLRTSWIYGWRGRNFLRTMLRLAGEREELAVVDDQTGAPTSARMVAEATALVVGRALLMGDAAPWGTYHLGAAGETTWCGFARAIVGAAAAAGLVRPVAVRPIATADYPTPARRPGYSVLDGARLRSAFGVALPDWREQLALVMAERAGPV